ncbi:hypothetical protein [Amycolatopsis sp. lyj-112]
MQGTARGTTGTAAAAPAPSALRLPERGFFDEGDGAPQSDVDGAVAVFS